MKGFEVNLYNRSEDRLRAIREIGHIELLSPGLEDVETGLAPITLATTDPAEALEGADILMVVVPAFAPAFIAEECAPYLRDGQIAVLNPGQTGGVLDFRHILTEMRCPANAPVRWYGPYVWLICNSLP